MRESSFVTLLICAAIVPLNSACWCCCSIFFYSKTIYTFSQVCHKILWRWKSFFSDRIFGALCTLCWHWFCRVGATMEFYQNISTSKQRMNFSSFAFFLSRFLSFELSSERKKNRGKSLIRFNGVVCESAKCFI